MKINDRIEPLVRAALDAAVKRDGPRFEAGLQAFSDDAAAKAGIELTLAIIGYVLSEVYAGKPSPEDLDGLAPEIAQQEAWMAPSAADVSTFLKSLVDGKPLSDVLPTESVIILAYLIAANLLTSSSKTDQGEWWFMYLDKVEAAIEAA